MSDHVAERLTQLETGLTKLETEFRTRMEHVATREDIERAKNSILRWLVATVIVAAGAVAAVISAVSI
ncbi:MAG: hypothetical protein OXH96_15475 [Spirochaetaceae bacterium]|nr:hypothetical protein [Spirochaetaceae bacterium]